MSERDFLDAFHQIVGHDQGSVTWWQMCIRAALLFIIGLVLVRAGGKRIFGRNSAFDIVLSVVIGSNLSRAITGNAPFGATVAACLVLVGMHSALTFFALGAGWFGRLIKGRESPLLTKGTPDRAAMRRAGITEHDLQEAARLAGYPDLSQVREAYLERSGDISVIGRRPGAR